MAKNEKNWFRRHWILSIILAAVILFLFITMLGNNPNSAETNIEENNRENNIKNFEIIEQAKVDYFDLIQVTDNKAPQYDPDVYDNIVVWVDERNGNKDIFMKDLNTGEEKQITFGEEDEYNSLIYEDQIIYLKENDIFLYDIPTSKIKSLTCDGVKKQIFDFDSHIILFQYSDSISHQYLISTLTERNCDSERKIMLKDYPQKGDETEFTFKDLWGLAKLQVSGEKIIEDNNPPPKKFLICEDYARYIEGQVSYPCSDITWKKITDTYLIENNEKSCILLNYLKIKPYPDDLYINNPLTKIRLQEYQSNRSKYLHYINYPCSTTVGDTLFYFKWDDEGNIEKYYLDFTEQNSFYEELSNPDILKKIEDTIINVWTKCDKWKNEGGIYEECVESQKILSIFYPKTNKIYELKANRYEYSGGYIYSWKKLVEKGDVNTLPEIEKISKNKIVWTDKKNERCIDEIGCDGNTDIYILQIKDN